MAWEHYASSAGDLFTVEISRGAHVAPLDKVTRYPGGGAGYDPFRPPHVGGKYVGTYRPGCSPEQIAALAGCPVRLVAAAPDAR